MNFGESLGSLKGCEGLEIADQDVVRKAQRLRYLGEIESLARNKAFAVPSTATYRPEGDDGRATGHRSAATAANGENRNVTKRPGRPVTRTIEPIPASLDDKATAICRDADAKITPKPTDRHEASGSRTDGMS